MSNWKTIETALRQHLAVKDCVVLGRPAVAGKQCLVAYIVSNQEEVTKLSELRDHLKRILPHFEEPVKFVFRTSLPTISDGTVDRAALTADDQPEGILPQDYVAPRTLNEKLMANVWQETLKLKDIGVYDNFFEIVRDSSLAMDVIKRVRKVFAVHLPVRALFADPTVAGMTAAVLNQQTKWTNRRGLAECVSDLHIQRREQARNHLSKN